MKIIHFINNLATGGAEKLILETLPLLNNQNINVDLLLINGNETPFLKLLRKNEKIKIQYLTLRGLYNPLLIFKLIKILKNYTIIHVHLFPALYYAALAKWIGKLNLKLVFTEHSTSNKRIRIPLLKYIDRWIYKKYDKIITISEKVEISIQKHLKLDNNHFVRIENGVNLNNIWQATPSELSFIENRKQKKILIQVSSFQYPKDQKTVIRALKHLPENVELILVGTGVLKTETENYAKELHLKNRVYFLGQRTDVAELLKASDIVILSSHYEGLSLSSIEGMASGKPFVACNVPGLREVVEGAGILFEKENDTQLSEIIIQLITDKSYYQNITKKCFSRAQNYQIEHMIEKTLHLYQSL